MLIGHQRQIPSSGILGRKEAFFPPSLFPHPDGWPNVSGYHHKVLEASTLSEPFNKRTETHEKHRLVLQLDDAVRAPKLGPQPSPWEHSFVGNRNWNNSPGLYVSHLPPQHTKPGTDTGCHSPTLWTSPEKGRGAGTVTGPGAPQKTGDRARSPLRPWDPEPRASEHDTSGLCNELLLHELMSPSALLGNLAQNIELVTLNFAVSKWK